MRLNRVNSAINRNERNKINENFDIIERGFGKTALDAQYAVETSDEAKRKAESTQIQLDTVVIEGDSSVEAAQARVSIDDTVYNTLKARLDAENEQVNQQLAQMKEKISGTVYVDAFAHLKDGDDWSPVISFIANNLGNAEIILPNEEIILKSQITFNTGGFKLRGQPNTKIINDTNAPLNSGIALFYLQGSRREATSKVTTDFNVGTNVVSVTNASEFKVGDYVAFHGYYDTFNISTVESIDLSANTLTLDRTSYYKISSGSTIYILDAIENVEISDLNIDLNNQYSYGVFVSHGKNVNVRRVNGSNIASKLLQFNNSFDCFAEDIIGVRGTNNSIGGNGYVLRVSVCNDCKVSRIIGKNVRHVVDLSGASRNTISNSEGYYNFSSDFLTHTNHCYDNLFIDCKSVSNLTSAYAFHPLPTGSSDYDAPGYDRGNIVQGGYIVNSPIIYHEQDGSNILRGITIKVTNPYALRHGGTLFLESCTIIADSSLIYVATNDVKWNNLTFLNCRFIVNVASGLGNMTNALNNPVNITFDNCNIRSNVQGAILLMPTNSTLTVKDNTISLTDNTQNFPAFVSKGIINSIGNYMSYDTSGISVFGVQDSGKILFDKCHVVNSSAVIRPYSVASQDLELGANTLVSSGYPSLNSFRSVKTIGAISIGATVIPDSDKFTVGSRVLNDSPTAGAADSWVYTSDGWRATSLVSNT